jgi:hypothetical protein
MTARLELVCVAMLVRALWMCFFLASCVRAKVMVGGFNFLDSEWSSVRYDDPAAQQSLQMIADAKGNYVALTFCWFQWDVDTPGPIYADSSTPTDAQLKSIIDFAHKNGVSVLMRPGVDPDWSNPNTRDTWRGMIGRNFTSSQWDTWCISVCALTLLVSCSLIVAAVLPGSPTTPVSW